jgi:hypothetical protein
MVFELNALFSMSPRLWCKSCLLHCHQGEVKDSRKEEREGTQVGRQTQRERERERRTIMGFCKCNENLSWRFAFFQH